MSDQGRVVILLLALAVPTVGAAQTPDVTGDVAVGQLPPVDGARPIAGRDRWHLDLAGVFFLEAWELNRFQEQLLGGTVRVSRHMTPSWTLGVETSLLHVNQEPVGDVFLPALSLMLQRSAFRFGETSVFLEGGGGASYASNEVPDRGTRFNFVFQTGVGLVRPLSSGIDLVGGLRWLHVSNNGLAGRVHNPDIQALAARGESH